jgi:hypothetical protein
MSVHLV